MKNQHFGDISDYRKYGLLRALQSSGDGRLLVAWMLTPDDGSRDGGFRCSQTAGTVKSRPLGWPTSRCSRPTSPAAERQDVMPGNGNNGFI